MNETNDLPFSFTTYNHTLFAIVGCVSYVLTILIFPFYSNVYRKNLAREKTTALFQVTQHFYKFLRIFCLLCCIPIPVILLGVVLVSFFIIMFGYALIFIDIHIVVYICRHSEILLGILAIQRFLLYFFPSTERYLGLSKNGFGSLIRFIYLTPPIAAVLSIGFFIKYGFLEQIEILIKIYTGIVSFLFLFSFFATLFYIPILISIRKLSHLSSAQLNKPQRYVLWQLVVMTTVKCITMSSLFFTSSLDFQNGSIIDTFCFPLVIELTYLGCNKRNLDTFLGSFNNNWIKTICSLLCRSTMKVAPQQHVYSINS